MAELKTKKAEASVAGFLDGIADANVRKDCETLVSIFRKESGAPAKMWGPAIVGFGDHHYKYASGREGDFFVTGFSPRKNALTLYFMSGLEPLRPLLAKLGPCKIGKGCLYLKSLDEVHLPTLRKTVKKAVATLKARQRKS